MQNLLSNANINAFLFKEVWTIDTIKNTFTKDMLAYCPMIDKYDKDSKGVAFYVSQQPLFWIKVKKEASKAAATIITDKMYYELGSTSTYNANTQISSKLTNAVNLITLKKAILNYSKVYLDKDFIENISENQFKSDVLASFDSGISLQSIKNNNLDGLSFIESWSYNPETQEIKKKIIGIGSIKSFYESPTTKDKSKGIRRLFYLKMN